MTDKFSNEQGPRSKPGDHLDRFQAVSLANYSNRFGDDRLTDDLQVEIDKDTDANQTFKGNGKLKSNPQSISRATRGRVATPIFIHEVSVGKSYPMPGSKFGD